MNLPKISIITTTYNHASYIKKCIDSVLSQSFHDWEMIIIDDGSTDRTGDICKAFSDSDPRIIYIQQANIGLLRLAESYNKALALCKADYVAILEGDDFWGPKKLEVAYKKMEEEEEIILYWAKTDVVDENGIIYSSIPTQEPDNISFYNNDPIGHGFGAVLNFFPAPLTWMVRKKALQEIGGFASFNKLPTTDLPTILQLIFQGKFYYDKNSNTFYRRHMSQATRQFGMDLAIAAKNAILQYVSQLDSNSQNKLPYLPEKITKLVNDNIMVNYFMAGRKLLIDQDWIKARKLFVNGLKQPGSLLFIWRTKAFLGIIFSYLHLNMEGLVSFLGKKTYN